MLFSLGLPGVIQHAARSSPVGKLLPDALYVHVSALSFVDPLLRLYEECASRTVGRMNETTLIKFHISEPKISYLEYPTFDAHPHPALKTSMQIDLRDFLKLCTDLPVPGLAAGGAILVFLGGVQPLTIGILGEYIGRIFEEVQGRPLFIVSETVGISTDLAAPPPYSPEPAESHPSSISLAHDAISLRR